MKGKLINEDNKWFVQYKTGKFEGEYLYGQLPLHPDSVTKLGDWLIENFKTPERL